MSIVLFSDPERITWRKRKSSIQSHQTIFEEDQLEKFIIEGGVPLKGEITPAGNKNAALPMLAAAILTDEPVVLHNVPNIRDVRDMRQLVAGLGVEIKDLGSNSWSITARSVRPADLDP